MNEVLIQTQKVYLYIFLLKKKNGINKLYTNETKRSLENSLKLERWQGLPYMNKVKWYEIVLSFIVSLFIQSLKQREFVYLVCLHLENQTMTIFLFKMFLPKPHSVPLIFITSSVNIPAMVTSVRFSSAMVVV